MTETLQRTTAAAQNAEPDDSILPSLRVIDAVASATRTDPLTMDPLYEAIDPDALDDLFTGAAVGGHVHFEYAGHEVTVHADGSVVVDGQTPDGQ